MTTNTPVQSAGTEYPKIQSVYKRDDKGRMVFGQFSCPEFEYLKNNLWTFTEKVDGTNIRLIVKDGQIKIGGKTERAQIQTTLYDALLRDIIDPHGSIIIEKVQDGVLYGEGYGAGIQKGGGNYSQEPKFVLFDVRIGGIWLKREDVADIANTCFLGLIPCAGGGSLYEMVQRIEGGIKSAWGDFTAEGLVARPSVELSTRAGHHIIAKIKGKDFVL